MEVTALCFRLLMLEFIQIVSDASSLRLTPNTLQHFVYESVSFHCEGFSGPTRLRGVRKTQESISVCQITTTPSGPSCTVEKMYQEDSGVYWCETEGGEMSNSVNICVSDDGVILEIPALPVIKGKAVTLRCRKKMSSSHLPADFYKDGLLITSSSTAEMTIKNVSKSDEGHYKCNISGVGESPESWLDVRENIMSTISSSTHKDHPSNNADTPHVTNLLWIAITILITILMLALVLVLVGCLYVRKHRVSSETPTAASHAVGDNQKDEFCGDDASDDDDDVTYTVVITKPREDKDTADAADNLSLGSNHSRKPRTETDKDKSSPQPVYSTLMISQTPKALQQESGLSSSTVSLSPTAAKDSSSTEQKPLFTTVQKVTKSSDA